MPACFRTLLSMEALLLPILDFVFIQGKKNEHFLNYCKYIFVRWDRSLGNIQARANNRTTVD